MTSGATYFKYSIYLIAIIGVFVLLKWTGCICNRSGGAKSDTLSHRIDTTYIHTRDTVFMDNPVPYKVTYYKDRVLHDTLETIETVLQHVDSARILYQYLATRFYDTTLKVQYGTATVKQMITQNRIESFSLLLKQSIPQVKETITLREPKRLLLLAGIQAFGNQDHLPYASGVTLDLLLKNGGMIGGGAYLTQGQPMYSAALKFPIRLKKRR